MKVLLWNLSSSSSSSQALLHEGDLPWAVVMNHSTVVSFPNVLVPFVLRLTPNLKGRVLKVLIAFQAIRKNEDLTAQKEKRAAAVVVEIFNQNSSSVKVAMLELNPVMEERYQFRDGHIAFNGEGFLSEWCRRSRRTCSERQFL
jgi:hypothetical protein